MFSLPFRLGLGLPVYVSLRRRVKRTLYDLSVFLARSDDEVVTKLGIDSLFPLKTL